MFPARREHEDGRGLFVVQDPQLRSKILPLFSFDPSNSSARPIGHGTALRIDPWGGCATAFHVVEDLLSTDNGMPVLRNDIRLSALEFEGIGYGRLPLPIDSWRPFSGMFSICGIERSPFGESRIRNCSELAALTITRSSGAYGPTEFLSLDIRRWRPRVGKRVMALGFADLDVDHRGEGDARAMTQYLYGSEGTIFETRPFDPSSSRPWPTIRVEADWPPGMSGGPVFSDDGHVIGIVSTGTAGVPIGTAVCFAGWDIPERTFSSLDASNPGWIRCYAALDGKGSIIDIAQFGETLEPLLTNNLEQNIRAVTVNPATRDYMLL